MKYSIVLLIVVSNYCMGMEIPLLLNPQENTLNALGNGWTTEPTYVQNSDQNSETNNTTGIKCLICNKTLSSKQGIQGLKQHMFFRHMYPTLDQKLKGNVKNCKIEKNGESNFVRCVIDGCLSQLKISKTNGKTFGLKRHLASCHFDEQLCLEIQKNPRAANLLENKRTYIPSAQSNYLRCPVEECSTTMRNKKANLQQKLAVHLFSLHLVPQDENLKKEIEQNWKDQKSKTEMSCWHQDCTKKFEVSQNTNTEKKPFYSTFASLKYHYAMEHCAEQLESFCGQKSITEYIDKYVTPGNKKQKTYKLLS